MNTEELKRLAEAATPGPWVSHPKGYYGAVCRADDQYDLVAVTHGQRRNNVLANEAYIAAANPATVLELIRQRDELLRIASDAATSLETIHIRSFGDDSYLNHPDQMRAYAGARAGVVRTEIKDAGIQ